MNIIDFASDAAASDSAITTQGWVMLVLTTLVGSGGVGAVVAAIGNRRKAAADKDKTVAEKDGIIASTYAHVLEDMRAELARNQEQIAAGLARIAELERRDARMRKRVRVLEEALAKASIPVPPDN